MAVGHSKKVTKENITSIEKDRRPGDPDKLIGSSEKAKEILGWEPKYCQLEGIIESAWKWHKGKL